MSYLINAWLEHGEPRLGIVNAQTGVVQQLWQLSKIGGPRGGPIRREVRRELRKELSRIQQSGIQQLAKELFLVGCAEDISLVQRARTGNIGDVCLNCDGCAEDRDLSWKKN
jgi:hypothetical protein